jgi:hypothetical protein
VTISPESTLGPSLTLRVTSENSLIVRKNHSVTAHDGSPVSEHQVAFLVAGWRDVVGEAGEREETMLG